MEMSGESLFSLEIVVDKVYIPHIECRFPAVAFRLLDFPTILIEHVEADLAAEIRHKISMDTLYEVPAQFSQLKDSHGNFMIKKGKSCLFKMTLESTRKHLSTTPLYVMVIDKYPTIPKFAGNTTVALASLMEQISKDVTTFGLMTPSVKGDKGLFKLHNLMGKEIGYIVIGYRLLFLGPGLIPHLGKPATEVINSEYPKEDTMACVDTNVDTLNLTNVSKPITIEELSANRQLIDDSKSAMLHDSPAKNQIIMVQTNSPVRESVDKGTNVNIGSENKQARVDNKLISTSTQTKTVYNKEHREASVKVRFRSSSNLREEKEQEIDLLNVPNTFCPPPLKYNSSSYPTMWLKRTPPNLEDTDSFDETSDSDISTEDHENIQRVNVQSIPDDRNKQLNAQATSMNNDRNRSRTIHQIKDSNVSISTVIQHLAEFPILSSLLQEISKLQLPNSTVNPTILNHNTENQKQLKENLVAKPNSTDCKRDNSSVHNIPIYEEKSSATRHERKSHINCAHPAQRVPRSAGWLGYEPGFKPKKSNLVFKTTVTQNLRVAKAQQSKVHSTKAPDIRKVNNGKTKIYQVEEFDNGHLSDLSTEIKRHTLDDTNISDESIKNSFQDKTFTSQLPNNEDAIYNRKTDKKAPTLKTKRRVGSSRMTDKRTKLKVKAVTEIVHDTETVASPKELNVLSEAPIAKKPSLEIRVPSVEADISVEAEMLAMSPGLQRYEPKFTDIASEASSESVENNSCVFIQSHMSEKVNDSVNKSGDYTLTESRFHSTGEPELQELMSEEEHSVASDDQSNRGDIGYSDSKSSDKNSAATVLHIPLPNPVLSEQSPIPSTRRSVVYPDFNIRQKHKDSNQPIELSDSGTVYSQESASKPQPTPRRYQSLEKKDSTITESVSSYVPSEEVNPVLSDASYSEDFSDEDDSLSDIDIEAILPKEQRFIPSTKLGFTIG